jgi:hypothetical protein
VILRVRERERERKRQQETALAQRERERAVLLIAACLQIVSPMLKKALVANGVFRNDDDEVYYQ